MPNPSHRSTSSPTRYLERDGFYSYSRELRIATLAVQRAAILTQKVFHETAKGTVFKDDKSPVTIGDYGAQALIISAIQHNFPLDEIVGEEEANTLWENKELSAQIWQYVKGTELTDVFCEMELGGSILNEQKMLKLIDSGKSAGGPKGRFWALDPIDGTKGFLRGGQYALCLALIEDAEVKVGVLACPNLPANHPSEPLSGEAIAYDPDLAWRGVLFSASIWEPTMSRPLDTGELRVHRSISVKNPSLKMSTFCESVEAGHSSHSDQAMIAEKLGITRPSVRMDSQAKYGTVARGVATIYLRLPVSATYQEKIWDHAAGEIIVRQAGGVVTDAQGKKLDFGQGRTLAKNKGIVAAPRESHPAVLAAVREVFEAK